MAGAVGLLPTSVIQLRVESPLPCCVSGSTAHSRGPAPLLCSCARPALTQCPNGVVSNNRTALPHSSGGRKCEIQVPAGPCSLGGLWGGGGGPSLPLAASGGGQQHFAFLGSQPPCSSLCPCGHVAFSPRASAQGVLPVSLCPSYEDASHVGSRAHPNPV